MISTLVGGPPCRLLTAGPCRIADDRNQLVRTFLDAVRITQPKTVLMENVPALIWRGMPFLAELTEALDTLGYSSSVVLLHAEAYGVPQLRRRLFMKAVLEGNVIGRHPRIKSGSVSTTISPPHIKGEREITTVGDAIGDLPLPGRGRGRTRRWEWRRLTTSDGLAG